MTQITVIKLGVIVMCVATVTLSLAQTPRIGTSGSKQAGATTGNSTRATPTVGAHPGTNAGAQTGFGNQAVGITGAAAGLSGLSGNSTGTTQAGANAQTGTNTNEHERRNTHWHRCCHAYDGEQYCSSPIHPCAQSPQPKFLDGGAVPLAATIGHGHPNSKSDPGASALIRHWRLSQRGTTHERSLLGWPTSWPSLCSASARPRSIPVDG
jgi:hypothetical protein